MSTYPSFPYLSTSSHDIDSGHEPARATNGSVHMRRMYSTEKGTFKLDHVLTASEKSTLDAFYAANRDGDVTIKGPIDGASYTCAFAGAPQYRRVGATRYFCSVKLLER